MSAALLKRLGRMSRDEVVWRTRVVARTHRQRLAAKMRTPRWDRQDLRGVLAPNALDAGIRRAIDASDWEAAERLLEGRIGNRDSRFVIDPRHADDYRHAILARWPDAARQAASKAERAMRGDLDLLGYRGVRAVDAEGQLDWHLDPVHNRRAPARFWADVPYLDPALGDHKVIWELNRHQHWLQIGRALWLTRDDRYARGVTSQLARWLDANPPLTGINWASMLEIGFRAISWVTALHLLLAPGYGQASGTRSPEPEARSQSPWLVDMLIALDRQLSHLERNLSYYFSPNTHLTGEALALYVVGAALPELAGSRRWMDTGRRILVREIDRQILPDGGHAERSTHYQRYTLDFYLLALQTARRVGDTEAAARFTHAAERLAAFTRTMADDSGRLPLIGDDDGGMLWPLTGARECNDVRDSLGLAAILLGRPELAPWGVTEEMIWLAGPAAADPPHAGASSAASRTLAETGYVVMRDRGGRHLVFDVGAHGYMNSGHAHADALAVTLTSGGRPFLVDPGTFTYTMDPALRDAIRSSASHNTVTIDGRSQSAPSGPFHWRTRTDAVLHGSRHNPSFDWAESSHDGYAPLRHRRSVLRLRDGVLVLDEILTSSTSPLVHSSTWPEARVHWHFDPGWMVTTDGNHRLHARHLDGDETWIAFEGDAIALAHGDDAGGAMYAPAYGTQLPTWKATIAAARPAPVSLATWIDGTAGGPAPSLERLEPEGDPTGGSHVVRVTRGTRASVVMLRPGELPPGERGCRACDYQTDARMLHYATGDGSVGESPGLVSLDLIDARQALALRDGWLSISSDDVIAELHAGIGDGVLDLEAAHPPARLRLEGHGASIGVIRLNGHSVTMASAEPGPLFITADQWPDPGVQKREATWVASQAL